MIKVVALFGKAGAGKDWLLNQIIQNDKYNQFKKVINCTTRPIRENEQDGVNYYYLTVEEFTEKVVNGDMVEATDFNYWFYGTMFSTLSDKKINVGVFNPTAVELLQADKRLQVLPIYVEAPDKLRLYRQLNRENEPDCHEIARRFLADEQDFNIDRIVCGIDPPFGVWNDEKFDINTLLSWLIPRIKTHFTGLAALDKSN